MNVGVGHRGRQVAALRRRTALPAAIPIAFMWLASAATAIAAPAVSTWSLLPAPTDARLAPTGVATIADGASIAVLGADRQLVQPTVDRFMQLVANTRGLRLRVATAADAHPAITFDVDPRASAVRDSGY